MCSGGAKCNGHQKNRLFIKDGGSEINLRMTLVCTKISGDWALWLRGVAHECAAKIAFPARFQNKTPDLTLDRVAIY
jgi:hypothetical protein